MCRLIQLVLVLTIAVALLVSSVRADVTAEQVKQAIGGGRNYLLSQQHPVNGNWPEHTGQPGGMTALCVLSLVNAGQDPQSKPIQDAVNSLTSLPTPQRTYAVAVQIMALTAVDADAHRVDIERLSRWLEGSQITDGDRSGAWAYSTKEGRGDNSNTQFALLGLHEAERAGVDVDPLVWRRAAQHFKRTQSPAGGWNYYVNRTGPPLPYTGSMTCAGISSSIIANGKLRQRDASLQGDQVVCCGGGSADDDGVEKALEFLGREGFFSLEGNPGTGSGSHWLYYLYGLERVGRLSGRRFIGGRDWYREGADLLVRRQRVLSKSTAWVGIGPVEGKNMTLATCYALLFLSKGRRPVVIAKLKHGDDPRDWDQHRGAVANLVEEVERSWKNYLTWQTIDADAASVEDLLETPVLFVSGTKALQWSESQKKRLKDYIEQGGFVLAEACDGAGCQGVEFANSFRALMRDLFPQSPWRPLPAAHPIWTAEQRFNLEDLPHGASLSIEGMEACCRTSVVLVNKTISGYWELHTGRRPNNYPQQAAREINACIAFGKNVLAYATNRQLKDKLDQPQVSTNVVSANTRRASLAIAALRHPGGAEEAPNALPNLVRETRRLLEMRVYSEPRLIAATDPNLSNHPILFMHGRRAFQFTPAERQALRRFLENGGTIIANAICGSQPFSNSVRREFSALYEDQQLRPIPPTHKMFSTEYQGFNLSQVWVRSASTGSQSAEPQRTTPYFEGLTVEDRLCVLFTPLDMSCALQNQPATQCEGFLKQDAYRLGMNLLLFALQQ